MSDFSGVVHQLMLDDRIGKDRFRQVISRLAAEGGLYPADSDLERGLYDDALPVLTEIEDYFAIMGCTLVHNPGLGYLRLYPPNSTSPAAVGPFDEEGDITLSNMRRKVSAHTGALAMALRMLYSQKLSSGEVINDGEVQTTVEEIGVTLKTRLNRDPAVTQNERKAILRELERGWRVIRIARDSDADDPATRVVIRPIIADLLSQSVAMSTEADAEQLDGGPEDDHEDGEEKQS
jgi:hypothetical protein